MLTSLGSSFFEVSEGVLFEDENFQVSEVFTFEISQGCDPFYVCQMLEKRKLLHVFSKKYTKKLSL